MGRQAQFYLMAENAPQGENLSPEETLACDLSALLWRQGKLILLWCADQAQAERLDDALWARSADEFVPHNLAGEITQMPTPVEVAWPGKRNSQRRDVCINLHAFVPEFISSFNHAIDFVPVNETAKQQARERYKHYRQMNWQMQMENP